MRFPSLCKNIILGCAVTLIFPFVSFAQDLSPQQVQEVIRKMRRALRENKFAGELVIKQEFKDRTLSFQKKLWVEAPDKLREEIILTPGEQPIVRVKNREQSVEDSKDHRVFRRRNFSHPLQFFPFGEKLPEGFEIIGKEGVKIAERTTKMIEVNTGRGRHAFTIKFWVDVDKWTILQREISRRTANDEQIIYSEKFTSIEYGPVFEPDLFIVEQDDNRKPPPSPLNRRPPDRPVTEEFANIDEAQHKVPFPLIIPGGIPEGFQLNRIRVTHEKQHISLHLNYSDGIQHFSVFETRGRIPRMIQERPQPGKIVPGKILELNRGPLQIMYIRIPPVNFTVISNLDPQLLMPMMNQLTALQP